MYFLMGVFSILAFLFFVAAFIGLISPKLVLFKWGKNITRFKTFMLFFILSISCVIANGVVASRQAEKMKAEELSQQERINAAKAAREKAVHERIVNDFRANKAGILSNVDTLISQKQFDLAEKEITKYDIKPLQADLSDVKKHLQKAVLDEKAKNTPDTDIEAGLKIYSELARIEPENEVYKEKLAHYKAETEKEVNSTKKTNNDQLTIDKKRTIEVKDQKKYNDIKIVSCKIHPDGEPNNFRGKALEFVLDQVLNENSDVSYIIKIETQTGFILNGDGFLTTSRTFDQPTEKWLINIFLWHRRHDPHEKWEKIEKEVNPGNIRRLHIILKTREKVIAERIFESL